MPSTPVIQHQKTAPGPPRATAVETPTILPVPSVAASVVDNVAKTERLIFAFKGHPDGFPGFSLRKMEVKGKEQMRSHKQQKEGATP